jgi:putative ABC transport system ATP-binding protein
MSLHLVKAEQESEPVKQGNSLHMVSVDALSKTVSTSEGALTILSHVSFKVAEGQTLAIVGASGSGKSTLLGLMAGLDIPSSGSVSLAQQNLTAMNEDERARFRQDNVGFVFQSFQLLPALTALENVMLPLELAGVRDARDRARNILDRVGLAARQTHYPRQLSGGEQQRVAIARAFVKQPKILFADEPTGNLDTTTGQKMVDLLFELNRERGATLILVTHDRELAARCDRRLTIVAGTIAHDSGVPA